jgi:hypothetical protein
MKTRNVKFTFEVDMALKLAASFGRNHERTVDSLRDGDIQSARFWAEQARYDYGLCRRLLS